MSHQDKLAPLFAAFVEALADALAERLSEKLERRGDDLLDRRTAGISGRLWDRLVASGELPVMRDGRRYVAKRGDVERALERRRVLRVIPPAKPIDPDIEALEKAGIRLARVRHG